MFTYEIEGIGIYKKKLINHHLLSLGHFRMDDEIYYHGIQIYSKSYHKELAVIVGHIINNQLIVIDIFL